MDFTFSETNITGGFWKSMQEKNRLTTINAVYDRFADTGRIKAMAGKWKDGEDGKPHIFWDSDVAKWIEGASYIIAKHSAPELEETVESIIDSIESAQWDDGYINSYYTAVEPENRFTVRDNHELYCAGHLIEAAVAYYYATGKDRFLRMTEKYADLIYKIFVEENSAAFRTPGHEEIEIALMRLTKATGNRKYFKLCEHFLNARGESAEDGYHPRNYNQSERPTRKMSSAEGHAVRALYLYSSMVDYAYAADDDKMIDACHRLFNDITNTKMYITGGVGSTRIGEAFTVSYDLPNSRAYTETCASIGLMFFSQRLLENENKARYADIVERVMYNGMISGLSLSGDAFFYENPLEISLTDRRRHNCVREENKERFSLTERIKVFSCSCCAPNLNRVLSSMERYFYHSSEKTLYVDQFASSEYHANGMHVLQKTNYPVDGKIELEFNGVERAAIRIPGWCDSFNISVPYTIIDGYAVIESPSNVTVDFEMSARLYVANSEVSEDSGKAALMYGPVVYCAERIDNDVNLHRLRFNEKNLSPVVAYDSALGLNTVSVNGYTEDTPASLYSAYEKRSYSPTEIRMIPFFAFANRGESDMIVWLHAI